MQNLKCVGFELRLGFYEFIVPIENQVKRSDTSIHRFIVGLHLVVTVSSFMITTTCTPKVIIKLQANSRF